jgi:gliding motility-associated-like protein
MTVKRSIAFLCFSCLLFVALSGQQSDNPVDTSALSFEQLQQFENMAADTTDSELSIPNVFSPNGDGQNDYIDVETDGITVYEFTVFTRSGSRVYHSLSPRIFWDGNSIGGKELSEGVYYYVVEEQGDDEPYEKAGFIHLFR